MRIERGISRSEAVEEFSGEAHDVVAMLSGAATRWREHEERGEGAS